jgi:hypothetical protein
MLPADGLMPTVLMTISKICVLPILLKVGYTNGL